MVGTATDAPDGAKISSFSTSALRSTRSEAVTSTDAVAAPTATVIVPMSIGTALKLFVLALIVFAVAFGLRRTFLWDVTPVSWDQEPQSLFALGAAFLLRSLENIAAVVAGLTLIAAGAIRLLRRRAA